MSVRVKVCGITRQQDVLAAASAGADALGFVFYAPSPRAVSAEQASELLRVVPPFVTTVGLFVDATAAEVEQVLTHAAVDLLQFHGDETPEFCRSFKRPYIKALRMQPGVDIAECAQAYSDAQGILLDAWVPGIPGGTGQAFDWNTIPDLAKPLILAGGLTVDNVQQAIQQTQPWAVDVSGGVEAAKGIKDNALLFEFIQATRRQT